MPLAPPEQKHRTSQRTGSTTEGASWAPMRARPATGAIGRAAGRLPGASITRAPRPRSSTPSTDQGLTGSRAQVEQIAWILQFCTELNFQGLEDSGCNILESIRQFSLVFQTLFTPQLVATADTLTGPIAAIDPFVATANPCGVAVPATESEGSMDKSASENFADGFRRDAEGAVEALVNDVAKGRTSARQAARVLLPYLANASYAQQNLVLDALLTACTPEGVLQAAVEISDDAVFEVAAGVLEHFGSRSWDVLANLANSHRPYCRHFVRVIRFVESPDESAKAAALVALAMHPDVETRWLAAEVAEGLSSSVADKVWEVLRGDPDERLRLEAEAQAR